MRSSRAGRRKNIAGYNALIGSVVIAALIAFTYISYNADSGLPLQQSYHVSVQLPSADRLINTDEVRIGGIRVGQVSSVSARLRGNGRPAYAVIGLDLTPSAGPLPADTHVEVQAASILGQTYVDLIPGHSRTTIPSGGTIPLRNASSTVELTDLLGIFRQGTRRAIRTTIGGDAEALVGRGPALNQTLRSLAPLLPDATHLSATLASPTTELAGFLHGTETLSASLEPVSAPLAELFGYGATTFDALNGDDGQLGHSIDAAPAAESAATTALGALAQPLNDLADLAVQLHRAGPQIPEMLRRVNATLTAGSPALRELPQFSRTLDTSLGQLSTLSVAPATGQSLKLLNTTMSSAEPLLAALTPAQTVCNVIGIWGPNFASTFGEVGVGPGPSIADIGLTTLGASGEELQHAAPSPNIAINYQPNENAAECESGNEPYNGTQQLANPVGDQSTTVPVTTPPTGVLALAQKAGLLNAPPGTPR